MSETGYAAVPLYIRLNCFNNKYIFIENFSVFFSHIRVKIESVKQLLACANRLNGADSKGVCCRINIWRADLCLYWWEVTCRFANGMNICFIYCNVSCIGNGWREFHRNFFILFLGRLRFFIIRLCDIIKMIETK